MNQDVIQGTVVWFATEKGFGFLKRDDGLPDVFVHYTAIQTIGFKTLAQGQRVEFIVEQGRQGLQASHCRVI